MVSQFGRGSTGRHPARNLRCDQEGHDDGRHAYQPQELIYRKHRCRPPRRFRNPGSIRPLRSLLIAGQKLVGIGRPGNREQRENRNDGQCFHGREGHLRLWPKTSALGAFSGPTRETFMAQSRGRRALGNAEKFRTTTSLDCLVGGRQHRRRRFDAYTQSGAVEDLAASFGSSRRRSRACPAECPSRPAPRRCRPHRFAITSRDNNGEDCRWT